ncbi:MAG: transcription-repair coupling factor [Kiritimatiellae bacterium]|nr:transcription-repair coupling factor [Kiritimatiellia bacterium]MCO5067273.1 transcription-repair coupling factor [Kiritimatiellia bacterium]
MNIPLPEIELANWADFFRRGGTFCAWLPPGSAPAQLAWYLTQLAERPLLWIVNGPHMLDRFHRDLQTLGGENARRIAYYPAWEALPGHGAPPHADLLGDRFSALRALGGKTPPPITITCIQALMQRTLAPADLKAQHTTLQLGQEIALDALLAQLERDGLSFDIEVTQKNQASLRGGILDIWPTTSDWPVRIEFFGSTIDSLRTFDPADQKSRYRIERVELAPSRENVENLTATLLDHLPPNTILVWHDRESLAHHAALYEELISEAKAESATVSLEALRQRAAAHAAIELVSAEATPGEAHHLGFAPFDGAATIVSGTLPPDRIERERQRIVETLNTHAQQGGSVHIHFSTCGARERFAEIFAPLLQPFEAFSLLDGGLSEGFSIPSAHLLILSEEDFYGTHKETRGRYDPHARRRGPRQHAGARVANWTDLQPGDYVVHIDHGIGKYLGLYEIELNQQRQEVLTIEYADKAKLYLPVAHSHLLSRYAGAGKSRPDLHTLGSKRWTREKAAAQQAVQDLAAQLLETQARRDALPGHAFGEDTPWQIEFEASFPYQETEDQERAIAEVKSDLAAARPMDRLVCGDVGYGKTEVAMRAAFKTVMGGKQVAIVVPTTILAQQHYDTFSERMAAYPIRIEMLSRFQTRKEQNAIVKRANAGGVDIVIGTHRLLQGDLTFHDLGLVIIDEEQRFGVAHKEHFKHGHTMVDMLTLTATPIPRTLYLSLTGAKDLSTIETPPQERLPVETLVVELSDETVREAILRELSRGGQAFYLHNRVHSMRKVHDWLTHLVPEARIQIAHGRMREDELAAVMRAFVHGEFDVLLCTTIIESGLDIPNVNTILIERSDRFGLAALYQLRGRVGRYKRKAYAYFLLPRHGRLLDDARKRLGAIRRYSQLGAGFRLAMRDLEIRGAGNLLGAQQSGHIAAVGFDLYCQLLKRTVAALKGEKLPAIIDCELRLDFIDLSPLAPDPETAAVLPANFVEDETLRLRLYREIASASSHEDLDRAQSDIADRFGKLPPAVARLITLARLRVAASLHRFKTLEVEGDKVVLTYGKDRYYMPHGKFPRLRAKTASGKLDELLKLIKATPK